MLLTPASPLLLIALCPDHVGVIWRVGRTARGEQLLACMADDGDCPWHSPLDALRQWLGIEAGTLGRARIRVVLSSRFVRHALVPWPRTPLHRDEALAWERLHLEAVYGSLDGWRIVCDPGAFGRARVACAVPQDLLDRLHDLLADKGLTMGPVVPYFVQAWNHWRRRLAAGQLFAVAESGRVVFGCYGRGGWESLRMVSSSLTPEKLIALSQRECALTGASNVLPVLLCAPGLSPDPDQLESGRDVEWLVSAHVGQRVALGMAELMECA